MKVLLTGSTGYIGRAVHGSLLSHGHEVIPVVRPGQHGLAIDLSNLDALRAAAGTVDAVIHAAASDAPRFSETNAAAVMALLDGLSPGAAFVMQGGAASFLATPAPCRRAPRPMRPRHRWPHGRHSSDSCLPQHKGAFVQASFMARFFTVNLAGHFRRSPAP